MPLDFRLPFAKLTTNDLTTMSRRKRILKILRRWKSKKRWMKQWKKILEKFETLEEKKSK